MSRRLEEIKKAIEGCKYEFAKHPELEKIFGKRNCDMWTEDTEDLLSALEIAIDFLEQAQSGYRMDTTHTLTRINEILEGK